jgi:hypothetical protein
MTTPGVGTYQAGETVYQGYSAQTSTASAKVILWQNNVLHLTNINGNFVSSEPIIGIVSNSNYVFQSYTSSSTQYEKVAKIVITPNPANTVNANSNYTYTTTITETPDL